MLRSIRRSLPTTLLLAALAACRPSSDSAPQSPAGPAVDACTLFTYEDAKAVAGESLAPMASTLDQAVGRAPSECIYNSGTLDRPRILSLLIRAHRSAESARRLLENGRSSFRSLSGGAVEDVPGLGDGALWVGGPIQQLHVVDGARELIITVQSPDGTNQLPQARRIAGKVLERLRAGQA